MLQKLPYTKNLKTQTLKIICSPTNPSEILAPSPIVSGFFRQRLFSSVHVSSVAFVSNAAFLTENALTKRADAEIFIVVKLTLIAHNS